MREKLETITQSAKARLLGATVFAAAALGGLGACDTNVEPQDVACQTVTCADSTQTQIDTVEVEINRCFERTIRTGYELQPVEVLNFCTEIQPIDVALGTNPIYGTNGQQADSLKVSPQTFDTYGCFRAAGGTEAELPTGIGADREADINGFWVGDNLYHTTQEGLSIHNSPVAWRFGIAYEDSEGTLNAASLIADAENAANAVQAFARGDFSLIGEGRVEMTGGFLDQEVSTANGGYALLRNVDFPTRTVNAYTQVASDTTFQEVVCPTEPISPTNPQRTTLEQQLLPGILKSDAQRILGTDIYQ